MMHMSDTHPGVSVSPACVLPLGLLVNDDRSIAAQLRNRGFMSLHHFKVVNIFQSSRHVLLLNRFSFHK
jgi:hypothetical protein